MPARPRRYPTFATASGGAPSHLAPSDLSRRCYAARPRCDAAPRRRGRCYAGISDRRAEDAELDRLAERCGWLPLALRAAGRIFSSACLQVEDYLKLLAAEKHGSTI